MAQEETAAATASPPLIDAFSRLVTAHRFSVGLFAVLTEASGDTARAAGTVTATLVAAMQMLSEEAKLQYVRLPETPPFSLRMTPGATPLAQAHAVLSVLETQVFATHTPLHEAGLSADIGFAVGRAVGAIGTAKALVSRDIDDQDRIGARRRTADAVVAFLQSPPC